MAGDRISPQDQESKGKNKTGNKIEAQIITQKSFLGQYSSFGKNKESVPKYEWSGRTASLKIIRGCAVSGGIKTKTNR